MLWLKRLLPQTLFARALLIIVTPLVLVQLVAAFIFYDRVWDTVTRRLAGAMAGDVATIVQQLARYPGKVDRDGIFATALAATGIQASLEEGAILAQTGPEIGSGILEPILIAALKDRVRRPFLLDVWSHPREVGISVQLPDGVLRLRAQRERLFTSTVYIFLMWMVGSSLIFFAIASVFMRNQVRPIRNLARAADEFGKGRDVPDFHPWGAAEVRQAAAAFIVMRERIRRFLIQRTEMLAGVSHDLRTPLTRMKLELALLGDGPSVAGLKSDVADMERMVESYLAFVRGEGEEQAEPTDLGGLLTEITDAACRAGNSVTLATDGDLSIPLRPQAMKRSLNNLVANATRHAAQVSVHAARRGRRIDITIDDDGPGIPPESREEVFRPFFRLDPARSTATGGVGLGLTIARDVVRSHGGDIQLAESPMGGLRAHIQIPV
ncbi:MAG: HAMP domain-containing protein [Proteobacteria bacterium]|nr:HAMP domain-containing protein [Pseudomonadota bacterium]